MLFSHRKGLKQTIKLSQTDGMDDELRNRLWNCLDIFYWRRYRPKDPYGYPHTQESNLGQMFTRYWHLYFKKPLDTLDDHFPSALREIREYFFRCHWNEVYDFIEFSLTVAPESLSEGFTEFANGVLEQESSAYRFVEDQIVQITSPFEIQAVEGAITGSKHGAASEHLRQALEHLSDRKNPDFRNSIKESISAVESICRSITGDSSATLGKALTQLERDTKLHPALKQSFSALYGYTNDADGIRHAMIDAPSVGYVDAKYMLVACSAFVSYMIGKDAKTK